MIWVCLAKSLDSGKKKKASWWPSDLRWPLDHSRLTYLAVFHLGMDTNVPLISTYPPGWLTHMVTTGFYKQQRLRLQGLLRSWLITHYNLYLLHHLYYIQCVKEGHKTSPGFKGWGTRLHHLVTVTIKYCGHFAHLSTLKLTVWDVV